MQNQKFSDVIFKIDVPQIFFDEKCAANQKRLRTTDIDNNKTFERSQK